MTILLVLSAALLSSVSGATATDCSHGGDACSPSKQKSDQTLDWTLSKGLIPACVRKIAVKYNSKDVDDKYLHCMAIGEIHHRCGAFWAYTASIGKEFQDLFGPGSASIDDLLAGFDGIGCAGDGYADSPSRVARCCKGNGWLP